MDYIKKINEKLHFVCLFVPGGEGGEELVMLFHMLVIRKSLFAHVDINLCLYMQQPSQPGLLQVIH